MGQLTLATDNVFGDDGGVHQLAAVTGDTASGYAVRLTVPVDTTTEPTGGGMPGGRARPSPGDRRVQPRDGVRTLDGRSVAVEDPRRRADAQEVLGLVREETDAEPVLWGTMVGCPHKRAVTIRKNGYSLHYDAWSICLGTLTHCLRGAWSRRPWSSLMAPEG